MMRRFDPQEPLDLPRENNYQLVRIIAAGMVLGSHSAVISTGDPLQEPWRTTFGVTPGTVAVDIFFVVSGFLVTQSLERRRSLRSFARARFVRIWPGLFVALLLTVMLMGASVSTMPAIDYLTSETTWRHFATNLTVVYRTEYELPGVFGDNPLPRVFNASLWSLKWEVSCYVYLAAAWWASHRLPFFRRVGLTRLLLLALPVLFLRYGWQLRVHPVEHALGRLNAFFFAGAMMYLVRERFAADHRSALLAGPVLAFSIVGVLGNWLPQVVFAIAYGIAMPLLLMWIAQANLGWLRTYNRAGDYSYGLYIYAFPLQQLIAQVNPGCATVEMLALSILLTLPVAMISWHCVEKPALQTKWVKG